MTGARQAAKAAPSTGRSNVLRPRSGTSAKAVLLTILGEFVLAERSAWTQTLIDALGAVGVEERNARQAISRLAEQGLLAARRDGRRVRRELTAEAIELLEAGTERIFGFGATPNEWDGRWLVVLCSVPEEHRSKRHMLRSRLAFAGFGFLSAGVALTPHLEREALAGAVLEELDLVANATVFRAEVGELHTATDLLHRAWDLDALFGDYRAFVRAFQERSPSTPGRGSRRRSTSSTGGGVSRSWTPRSPTSSCRRTGRVIAPETCSTTGIRAGPTTPAAYFAGLEALAG